MLESFDKIAFKKKDIVIRGKSVSDIQESKNSGSLLIAAFGGSKNFPCSVMKAERTTTSIERDASAAIRNYSSSTLLTEEEEKQVPDSYKSAYKLRGSGCGNNALSTFPQNIGRSTVLFYSNLGDVVFDPFAGHNSRMELCVELGRHYIGCDISTDFMKFNKARASELREKHDGMRIKLHHCDSRNPPVKDNQADFTITSPPYYDIEYYGDEPEQLGKSETYQEFLTGIRQVLKQNLRILKPGAFAVWFVNDFRRKWIMHFYHMDLIRAAKKVGFIAHDLMIVELPGAFWRCFPNKSFKMKILPKKHEYGIVLRKPLAMKRRNCI